MGASLDATSLDDELGSRVGINHLNVGGTVLTRL